VGDRCTSTPEFRLGLRGVARLKQLKNEKVKSEKRTKEPAGWA
jgi:hypothetical protein